MTRKMTDFHWSFDTHNLTMDRNTFRWLNAATNLTAPTILQQQRLDEFSSKTKLFSFFYPLWHGKWRIFIEVLTPIVWRWIVIPSDGLTQLQIWQHRQYYNNNDWANSQVKQSFFFFILLSTMTRKMTDFHWSFDTTSTRIEYYLHWLPILAYF